ncbi:MAG: hypothetical protein A3B90_00650 [Candidatus Magasanikbacteria bacterium RIFCSPHIGHO2_02_FULL_41_13]|uniref:DUF2304 domain-containing protein n=1 Tax=Candidatus Magasanikbacteria bacterium RIFCSPHIGHO2_02_FULL_41_13 TaxID=1798676 RepID=A0A1F6M6Y5_9BACT|nr:MAG: hypothetical protein A3B90_00650 [Candidatus Magasanikbacteria bacterium RIFCSPHIGHO2_02_FULL_41_13]
MLFQILILLFSLFAIVSIFFRRAKDGLGIRATVFWILFWLGVDLVVLVPNSTTVLANKLGIGRGVDLVVYVSILMIFFILFRLNVKIEGINRQITKIVRKNAIDDVKKK